ncbi:hypothetical protein N7449_000787 [Penicillium cf. viridicatum]|uniref:Uncharacterized protein n=1 Tax=Penicillium cf. viridicatum TaxID=2972119 RepID=A0A9W9T8M2_9EURO|nr:hypothetical protein N7449_000787 [Penicillium cf. viridicatum]
MAQLSNYHPQEQLVYHHWNWDLEGPTIQDQGVSTTDLSTVIEHPSDVIDIRERRRVPKREFDQEASFYIFQWLSVNGEDKHRRLFIKDWIDRIWKKDEGGQEAEEADEADADEADPGSKGLGQREDRVKVKDWVN